MTKKLV